MPQKFQVPPPPPPPKSNAKFFLLIFVAVATVAGYFVYMYLTKPEGVMNIVYEAGGTSGSVAGAVKRTTRRLDNVYSRTGLNFANDPGALDEVMKTPAKEVIAELNQIGLSREELVISITNLLSKIEDDLMAKNMVTNYIVSFGFKVSGEEYVKLLTAADVEDDFYYANVIKSTAEFVTYPLTLAQIEGVLGTLADADSRIRSANVLERERLRTAGP